MTPRALLAAAVSLFLGCGMTARSPGPPPSAAAVDRPPAGPVRVSLLWAAPVDLDLYVTDPTLETVYFANNPAGSGGRLGRDVTCGEVRQAPAGSTLRETAEWAHSLPGRYRVSVDFPAACDGRPGEVSFRVLAEVRGERIERTGALGPVVFEPIVLEFDLDRASEEHSPKPTP